MPVAAIPPVLLQEPGLRTPAFVYEEGLIKRRLAALQNARRQSGLKVRYSIKALPFKPVLELMLPWLDGFSVSSLFEAKLAASVLGERGGIHLTSPGLRAEEMGEIAGLCDRVSFNSLGQWRRFYPLLSGHVSAGLRVNPEFSRLNDMRYDPCRPHSKLGVPLSTLAATLADGDPLSREVRGIHFHNSFQSSDFSGLEETVAQVESTLGSWLERLEWINLGGGYVWEQPEDLAELSGIVDGLRRRWGVEVVFEPGKAVVGAAGYLVARVLDVFDSGGKTVAVLDTSVNHHPEVFEYQRRPRLLNEEPAGPCAALLAGGTCLAGDLFGEYRFVESPGLGDLMVFCDVGAYSLIKANRFNGHNLPAVYAMEEGGRLLCRKSYGYADYHSQWSGWL